jgi:L-alanine-DL-glutamate epimerase-like enolase superfamily enzyme
MEKVGRYELAWVEEPVWPPDDFDSLEKLNRIGPVAAGENAFSYFEFKSLMERGALTFYQPDVAKMGGVTPALKVLALARKHKAKVAFHNRPGNGWVGAVASSHLAARYWASMIVETPPNEIPEEFFRFEGSIDKVSMTGDGLGLGIEPLESIPKSNESVVPRLYKV